MITLKHVFKLPGLRNILLLLSFLPLTCGYAQERDLHIIYGYAEEAHKAGQEEQARDLLLGIITEASQKGDQDTELKSRVLLSDVYEKLRDFDNYFINRDSLASIYYTDTETHEDALARLLSVNLQYRIYLQHWDKVAACVDALQRLSTETAEPRYHFRALVLQVAAALRQDIPAQAGFYLSQADSVYKKSALQGDASEPDLYLLYSTYLFNHGQLREALAKTEEGIRQLNSREMSRRDSSFLSSLYNNVGVSYLNIGDFEAAIIHFRNAVTLTRELGLQSGSKSWQQKINLITAASTLEEWDFALEQINSLNEQMLVPQNRLDSTIWLQSRNNILYTYLKAGLSESTIAPVVKEIRGWEDSGLQDYLVSYRFLGWYAATFGDSTLAFDWWRKGNQYAAQLEIQQTQNYYYHLNDQIKGYVHLGRTDSAARYLGLMDALFSESDKAYQLNLNSILQSMLNRYDYLQLCRRQGREAAKGLWPLSLEIEEMIDSLRLGHATDNSKQLLAARVHKFYESMIGTAATLYKEKPDPAYLEAAFRICQKSKSGLLLDELRRSGATSYAGIPNDLLLEERNLKSLIQYYQEQLHLPEVQRDSKARDKASKELFRLQEAKLSLEQRLAADYPAYYDLSYQNRLAAPDNLWEALQKQGKEAFVEFFAGSNTIFTFLVTGEGIQLLELPRDEKLVATIEDYLSFLHDARLQQALSTDSLLQRYVGPAHALYRYFIAPIEAQLGYLPEQWVISPDGLLGFLPMESLIVKKAEKGQGFSDLDYLIRKTTLSYSYSASVWLQNAEHHQRLGKNSRKLRCLGFAPGYLDLGPSPLASEKDMIAKLHLRSGSPATLAWSLRELDSIRSLFDGDYYHDSLATRERFLQVAGDYRMIHLAMHGFADADNPMQSGLLFSPAGNGQKVETLYAYELTNLRLNADLVVLSACETGVGKYMRGEGIMSLARSFMYAGASSVVMTLWKIEDETTAGIMNTFYEELQQEMPKDAALRQAKLQYLDNSYEQFANPFYWSGFVMMGETGSITQERSDLPSWWWLFLLLIVPIGFFAFRRKLNGVQSS